MIVPLLDLQKVPEKPEMNLKWTWNTWIITPQILWFIIPQILGYAHPGFSVHFSRTWFPLLLSYRYYARQDQKARWLKSFLFASGWFHRMRGVRNPSVDSNQWWSPPSPFCVAPRQQGWELGRILGGGALWRPWWPPSKQGARIVLHSWFTGCVCVPVCARCVCMIYDLSYGVPDHKVAITFDRNLKLVWIIHP